MLDLQMYLSCMTEILTNMKPFDEILCPISPYILYSQRLEPTVLLFASVHLSVSDRTYN